MTSRDYNRLHGANLNSAQESFETNSVILNRNDRRIFGNKECERKKKRRIKLAVTFLCKTDNNTEVSALIKRKRDRGLKAGISPPVSDMGTLR